MKVFLGDRPSLGNNIARKRRTKERTPEEWKELGLKFWSFSRLNAFETCPRMYELTYVKRLDETPNFFAEFGSFVHKIYEMYADGKLRRNQLLAYYRKHWKENVVTPAPYSEWVDFEEKWFGHGCDAMKSPPSLREYEILGVEMEVDFMIADEKAVGFIDLLLRRKKDEAIIIADHKSGKPVRFLRSGRVSKPDAERFLSYRHQLYLYSGPIIEKYGKVDFLRWNFFNAGTVIEIPWIREEYDEAQAWAARTIKCVSKCKTWSKGGDSFFCSHICGQRRNCQ